MVDLMALDRAVDEEYLWSQLMYEESVLVEGFGTLTRVASWGGEGDGAKQYVVFTLDSEPDRLFLKGGTYSSWDSDYWDDAIVEVEPFQETVTRYRKV